MNHDKVDTGYPPGLRSLWKARRLLPKWVWFYMLILAGVSLFLIEQIMVSWEWPADPYMLVVPGILIMGIPGAMIQGFGHLAGIELGSIARSETACQDPIKNEPFSPMVGSRFDVFRELSNSDMGILVGFFALAVVSCTGFIIQLRTYSFLVKAFPAWPLVFVLTVVLFSYTMFLISNRLLCHAAINRAKEVKKDLFPDDSAQDGTAPTSAPSENTVPLLSVVKFFRMKAGASRFLFIFVALLEAMSWLCLFFALGLLVYQTYHPLQPMSLGLVAVGPLGWGMFSGLATAMASWHLLHAENMQLATLAIRTTKDSA